MLTDELEKFLFGFYAANEFPALRRQSQEWRRKRPLAGVRILDGTPVFRNTVAKYWALLNGGAGLTVSVGAGIPCDEDVVRQLSAWGIPVLRGGCGAEGEFDVVCDCAGAHRRMPSRFGYVELTRSGCPLYQNCRQPVYVADAGRIKIIETALGTGDGMLRALVQLGYREFNGRLLLLFGCGKVGRGVAWAFRRAGAGVVVVDDPGLISPPAGVELISRFDLKAVRAAIAAADVIVSATGIGGALAGIAGELAASRALIANAGVEDEFGAALPEARVLNRKAPLNFILDEPTHLKYIDPSLALHNHGVVELLRGGLASGLNVPSAEVEDQLLDILKEDGAVASELEYIDLVAG